MPDGQPPDGMGWIPRMVTITPAQALATLRAVDPPARRWLAVVLSQVLTSRAVGGVSLAAADLVAAGLAVGRGEEGPPDALLDDVTVLEIGTYTPPGVILVLPNERLLRLLWALVTGEAQTYQP